MSLIEVFALAAIVLAALYLLSLGAATLVAPARASRFLLGFASSQSIHFLELSLRFVVGVALVLYAPRMFLSGAFDLFGWVLLVTTACLLLIPWRWHHRFAQHAVPLFTRHIVWVGLVSLAIGGFILAAVVRGSAA
jgi:hypothetical protein